MSGCAGMALRHGMLIAANLPQVVWRSLVALPVPLADLRDIDTATAEVIESLLSALDEVSD